MAAIRAGLAVVVGACIAISPSVASAQAGTDAGIQGAPNPGIQGTPSAGVQGRSNAGTSVRTSNGGRAGSLLTRRMAPYTGPVITGPTNADAAALSARRAAVFGALSRSQGPDEVSIRRFNEIRDAWAGPFGLRSSSGLHATYATSGNHFRAVATLNLGGGGGQIHDRSLLSTRGLTVNDAIYWNEFVDYRYGGGCYGYSPCGGMDPTSPVDGFLAEPVAFDQLYSGLNGSAFAAAVAAANPSQVPPLTTLERADAALVAGDAAEAVAFYQEHLKVATDDSGAKIRLALAMLEEGNASDATALLHMTYSNDPALADVSLRPVVAELGAGRVRGLVSRTVAYANRTGAASAWMVVSMLMEAEGRNTLAGQMLDKSRGAGLDPVLESRIRALIEQG